MRIVSGLNGPGRVASTRAVMSATSAAPSTTWSTGSASGAAVGPTSWTPCIANTGAHPGGSAAALNRSAKPSGPRSSARSSQSCGPWSTGTATNDATSGR